MGFALYDVKEFGEALHVFERMQVVEAGHEDQWQHSQYGITIDFIPHAQERLKKPFVFIANQEKE